MSVVSSAPIAGLSLGWIAYFALHSLLASHRSKVWILGHWPHLNSRYRLLFNLIAALLLVPLGWAMWHWQSPEVWAFHGAWAWLANGLALAAVAGFFWTTRYYDMGVFLGTRQWRYDGASPDGCEGLTLSPIHRWVRHPWYSLGLVILWTRDMDQLRLVSALLISGYLVIGSHLEERKLIAQYGAAYRRYRERVPGLIPRPWRHLAADEANRLQDDAYQR